MTAARKAAPPDAEIAALLDLLGRARRALARADEVELGRLLPLLAGLESAPSAASDRDPAAARRALLSLLDEAGQLAAQIRREQARLAAELRAAGVHRRAGFAYRRRQALAEPGLGPDRLSPLPRRAGFRSRADRAVGLGGPALAPRRGIARRGAPARRGRDPADRSAAQARAGALRPARAPAARTATA